MPITAGGDTVATLMFNAGRAAAAQLAASVAPGATLDPATVALAVKKAEMEAFVTWFTTNALVTVTGVTVGAGVAPGVIT